MTARRPFLIAIPCVLLAIVTGGVLVFRHHQPPSSHGGKSSDGQHAKSDGGNQSAAAQSTATSGGQTVSSAHTTCSDIFNLDEAQQVLGSSVIAEDGNGVTAQDSSTTVSTCAYSTGQESAKVVAHVAITSVGASTNEVHFGSGQPSGAEAVSGYGSTAYWQSATNTLNILKDNNWYEVTGTEQGTQTQAAAQKVASIANLAKS